MPSSAATGVPSTTCADQRELCTSRWMIGLLWTLLALGILEQSRLILATSGYTFESGIWSMLADDLLRGEFYRPVIGEGGYGGTRYMPGFFVLLAAVTRVVGDPVVAGALLFQATVVALGAAIWGVLRQLRVPSATGVPLAGLIVCSATYQDAWFTPRCEHLAAALLLCGLYCLLRLERGGSSRWIIGCGVAICGASFVKFTSVIMVLVPTCWLLQQRRFGPALLFVFGFGAMGAAGVASVQWLSHGRFIPNVLAATWGSGSFGTPFGFLRSFWNDASWGDPLTGVILGAAFMAWVLGLGPTFRRGQSALAFFSVIALAETLIIHQVPGTVGHHNTLLHATSLLTFGWLLARGGRGALCVAAGCGASAAMFVVMAIPGTPSVRSHFLNWGETTKPRIQELLAPVPLGAYYIANNPMLPLTRGERPYAIDLGQGCFFSNWSALAPKPWVARLAPLFPFDLEAAFRAGPEAARDFAVRVSRGAFVAVALTDWQHVLHRDYDYPETPLLPAAEEAFWQSQYPAFQQLRATYQIIRIRRPYVLLMPRVDVKASSSKSSLDSARE